MKKRALVFICAGLILGVIFSCQSVNALRCGPGLVWVPGYEAPDGTWVKGFCRSLKKPDFVWIVGHYGPKGKWIPGHWKPTGPIPPGKAWVPGHVNAKGKWVPGQWRLRRAPGKKWVPRHRGPRGRLIPGHWR